MLRLNLILLSSLLFSPLVLAQSSATVFGLMDLGVSYKNDGKGKTWTMDSGLSGASRLGFKGTESLEGNLKINFLLEMKIGADNGSSDTDLFSRSAWVGLSGDLGSVNFGRHRSLAYTYGSKIDLFAEGLLGKLDLFHKNNLMRSNSVTFISTPYLHTTFAAQYGMGEVVGNAQALSSKSLMAAYVKDQLQATAIWESTNNAQGKNVADGEKWILGTSYQLNVFKLHAMFVSAKGYKNVTDIMPIKKQISMVGISKKQAAHTYLVNFTQEKNQTIQQANAHRVAVGYLYELSKRTSLYTSMAYVSNDKKVKIMAEQEGAKPHLFNLGMRHQF